MKTTSIPVIFVITILALTATGYSQTPGEQLPQWVGQLQKTPSDNALREKIIKVAVTMKPAPAVPDEAIRFEGRAQYAFKSAKSEADYLVAAQEYEKAVAAAPWVSGYYSDLCTIYDKAGKPEDAKRNCQYYLIGLTDPEQVTDAKRRIAGLDFAIEKAVSDKANSPEAKAAREQENAKKELVDFLRSLDGAVFVESWETFGGDYRRRAKVKIRGGELAFGHDAVNANGGHIFGPETALGEQFSTLTQVVKIDSRDISLGKTACPKGERDVKISIDKTGRSLTLTSCDVSILNRQ